MPVDSLKLMLEMENDSDSLLPQPARALKETLRPLEFSLRTMLSVPLRL